MCAMDRIITAGVPGFYY